jgi:hypothetical protein
MTAIFFDRQDVLNPENGLSIHCAKHLQSLLRALSKRPPFFAELLSSNGAKLLIGIGMPLSCAQYGRHDGTPPYFMALSNDLGLNDKQVDFLIGHEASSVPGLYCLPFSTVEEIAIYFLKTGDRSAIVNWEEI